MQFKCIRPDGSRHPMAKLRAEDVLDARRAAHQVPQKSIADALQVS
jgi:hypothetical protein